MNFGNKLEKKLCWDEKAAWGKCPVCSAPHGNYCFENVLGEWVAQPSKNGTKSKRVHLGRLEKAPNKVKIVPAD